MNEEKLILVVQKYPELWDTSHAFYRDQERKDVIWEEIAKNNFPNKTGDECKKKWFLLRDSYRRSLNKRKSVTGQASKKIKLYRFEPQMQFLRSHFEGRSQLSNFDSPSENESNEDEEDTFTEDLGTESSTVTSQPFPSPSIPLHSSKSSAPSLRKKTKQPPVRAAEVLQSYLNRKPSSTQEDQLSTFFRSMELNVRTFPHPLQIEAKQKIFEVVTKLEQQVALCAIPLQEQRPPFLPVTLPQNNTQFSASHTISQAYPQQQHSQSYDVGPYNRTYGSHFTPTMIYSEQQQSQRQDTHLIPDSNSHFTPTMETGHPTQSTEKHAP